MAKKTDYMPILAIGALGALLYFMSKRKTDGDNGGFQLPGLPDIGINIPTSFDIPTLPEVEGFTCPGLTMPDLSNLLGGLGDLDLGLGDLDLGLGDLDLGLPDLGLPDLGGGERKTWNPLWFLPDIRFDLPSISFPGLPGLPRLPGLPESSSWLDNLLKVVFLPASLINPALGFALTKTVQYGAAWVADGTSVTEDASECPGGVCPTTSRSAMTPFLIPGPVGAESAPVAKVVVPPVGGVGAPDRELPFVT